MNKDTEQVRFYGQVLKGLIFEHWAAATHSAKKIRSLEPKIRLHCRLSKPTRRHISAHIPYTAPFLKYYFCHLIRVLNICGILIGGALATTTATATRTSKEQGALSLRFCRMLVTGGGGGTPLYGLYGDVPLDRVWFLVSLP